MRPLMSSLSHVRQLAAGSATTRQLVHRMASKLVLYWGAGSAPCWRNQLVLEEKGLQGYDSRLMSFDKMENKCEEVMKLNPRGQFPTFKHGNLIINESLAAIEFLERVYKGQGTVLIPEDPAAMALVLQRQYEAMNMHYICLEDTIYYQTENPPEAVDQEVLKSKKQALFKEVGMWEVYLSEMADGSHIAGKDFSMADVVFFPSLAFTVRCGLQLDPKFPHLSSYYNMLTKRPSVKATWPPHWHLGPGTDLVN